MKRRPVTSGTISYGKTLATALLFALITLTSEGKPERAPSQPAPPAAVTLAD